MSDDHDGWLDPPEAMIHRYISVFERDPGIAHVRDLELVGIDREGLRAILGIGPQASMIGNVLLEPAHLERLRPHIVGEVDPASFDYFLSSCGA